MGGLPYISYSGIINTNHLCQNLASIPEAHQKTGLASRPGLKCGMRLTMRRPWEASSTDARRATVRVIHTDEELMIARSVCRVRPLQSSCNPHRAPFGRSRHFAAHRAIVLHHLWRLQKRLCGFWCPVVFQVPSGIIVGRFEAARRPPKEPCGLFHAPNPRPQRGQTLDGARLGASSA
jgi:hypothetical protein